MKTNRQAIMLVMRKRKQDDLIARAKADFVVKLHDSTEQRANRANSKKAFFGIQSTWSRVRERASQRRDGKDTGPCHLDY